MIVTTLGDNSNPDVYVNAAELFDTKKEAINHVTDVIKKLCDDLADKLGFIEKGKYIDLKTNETLLSDDEIKRSN